MLLEPFLRLMRLPSRTAGFVLLIVLAAGAQSANPVFYAESFRQGPTKITDDSFEAKLTPDDPIYKERVKDTRGADRYIFTLAPVQAPGETQITGWRAQMTDLHHSIYDNILTTTPGGTAEPKDILGWLNPWRFAAVPIGSRRIIKVDGFYVVLQVTAYHFMPPDSPYLDSMTVDVKLTNNDPRQQ